MVTQNNSPERYFALFQGGGCKGVALAGAYARLVDESIQFDGFGGASAGSIIAVLAGAGASPAGIVKAAGEIPFGELLAPPVRRYPVPYGRILSALVRLKNSNGIYSTDAIREWVETQLRGLTGIPGREVRFSDLKRPTMLVATDIVDRSIKVWSRSRTPDASVSEAVAASCAIPGLFTPVADRYVDGGAISNLPTFVFTRGVEEMPITASPLAFTLIGETQKAGAGIVNHALQVVGAAVEGAQKVHVDQSRELLQISIPTGEVRTADFMKMDAKQVKKLVDYGTKAAEKFLASSANLGGQLSSEGVTGDRYEMYTRLSLNLRGPVTSLIIHDVKNRFVFELFPSLIACLRRGARISVTLPSDSVQSEGDKYRRGLLRAMGVEILEQPRSEIVPRFLSTGSKSKACGAYVLAGGSSNGEIGDRFSFVSGVDHMPIIKQLHREFVGSSPEPGSSGNGPSLEALDERSFIKELAKVEQYRGEDVTIRLSEVSLNDLCPLTMIVNEYKYNQLGGWIDLFGESGLKLFTPARICFPSGVKSIATPPVVERHDGRLYLIEGNTRAALARDLGLDGFTCAVVDGVKESLPVTGGKDRSVADLVTRSGYSSPGDRYEGFDYSLFRHIERDMHPLSSVEPDSSGAVS